MFVGEVAGGLRVVNWRGRNDDLHLTDVNPEARPDSPRNWLVVRKATLLDCPGSSLHVGPMTFHTTLCSEHKANALTVRAREQNANKYDCGMWCCKLAVFWNIIYVMSPICNVMPLLMSLCQFILVQNFYLHVGSHLQLSSCLRQLDRWRWLARDIDPILVWC